MLVHTGRMIALRCVRVRTPFLFPDPISFPNILRRCHTEGRGAGGGDVDVTIPRKTLVLDLDETLIHTLTQKYIGSNRCDLKVVRVI